MAIQVASKDLQLDHKNLFYYDPLFVVLLTNLDTVFFYENYVGNIENVLTFVNEVLKTGFIIC